MDTFHFTVGFTIKTTEAAQLRPGYVLPNPANDHAELHWEGFERFRLFNHLGQLEFYQERGASVIDINLTGLAQGIHHYVFEKPDGPRVEGKLVIAR